MLLAVLGGLAVLFGLVGLSSVSSSPPPTTEPLPTELPTDPPPTEVSPTEVPSTEEPPTIVPEQNEGAYQGAAESEGTGTLTLVNETSSPICVINVSPNTADTWGPNQLDEDRFVASGDSFTVTGLPADDYDYRALDCSDNVLSQHFNVTIDSAEQHWEVAPANATVTISNESSETICYLFISSTQDGAWGVDRLDEDEVVGPGAQVSVNVASGDWDMRAETCDGAYWEQYEVPVSDEVTWTITGSGQTSP